MHTAALLVQVLGYESLQNAPTIIGFVLAAWLWENNRRLYVIALMLIGCIMSAVLIEVLEPYKVAGTSLAYTPASLKLSIELVGNMLAFMITLAVGLLYIRARWSSRKTDLLVGVLIGVMLAIIQGISFLSDPANQFSLVRTITHTLAFAIGGPVALLGVRFLKGKSLSITTIGAIVLTVVVSLVITVIDYGPKLID